MTAGTLAGTLAGDERSARRRRWRRQSRRVVAWSAAAAVAVLAVLAVLESFDSELQSGWAEDALAQGHGHWHGHGHDDDGHGRALADSGLAVHEKPEKLRRVLLALVSFGWLFGAIMVLFMSVVFLTDNDVDVLEVAFFWLAGLTLLAGGAFATHALLLDKRQAEEAELGVLVSGDRSGLWGTYVLAAFALYGTFHLLPSIDALSPDGDEEEDIVQDLGFIAGGLLILAVFGQSLVASVLAANVFGYFDINPTLLMRCPAVGVCVDEGVFVDAGQTVALRGDSSAAFSVYVSVGAEQPSLELLQTIDASTPDFTCSDCLVDIYANNLASIPQIKILFAVGFVAVPVVLTLGTFAVYGLRKAWENREDTRRIVLGLRRSGSTHIESGWNAVWLVSLSALDVSSDLFYVGTQEYANEQLFRLSVALLVLPGLVFVFFTVNTRRLWDISVAVVPLGEVVFLRLVNADFYSTRSGQLSQLHQMLLWISSRTIKVAALVAFVPLSLFTLVAWPLFVILSYVLLSFTMASYKLMVVKQLRALYFNVYIGDASHKDTPFLFNLALLCEAFLESLPQLIIVGINGAATGSVGDATFMVAIIGSVLPLAFAAWALLYRIYRAGFYKGLELSLFDPVPEDVLKRRTGLGRIPSLRSLQLPDPNSDTHSEGSERSLVELAAEGTSMRQLIVSWSKQTLRTKPTDHDDDDDHSIISAGGGR